MTTTPSRRRAVRRTLGTGLAGLALVAAADLALAQPAAAEPNVLQCSTRIDHANNIGYGTCHNPGKTLHAFSIQVVCGMSVDRYSNYVYVSPGQTMTASAQCRGPLLTGVGGVNVIYGG